MSTPNLATQGLSLGLAAVMTVFSVAHLGCATEKAEPASAALTTANWVDEDGVQVEMSVVDNGNGTGSVFATTTTALGKVERTKYLIPIDPESSDRNYQLETAASGEHYLEIDKQRFPIINLEKGIDSTTGTLVLPNGAEVDFATGGLNHSVAYLEISILFALLGAIVLVAMCGFALLDSLNECMNTYGNNSCWTWAGPGTTGLCEGSCRKCNEGIPGGMPPDPGDTEGPGGP